MNKQIDAEDILSRIKITIEDTDLTEVDFVIENVREDEKVMYIIWRKTLKKYVFILLHILYSHYTYRFLYIERADKVMWEHFMNPILMENFAQVIKGFHTSDSTIQTIDTLLQSVGIEIKLVNDSEGVASNRLSHLSFI